MTADNYKAYLENEKSQGREVSRPFRDNERAKVWDQVFAGSGEKAEDKTESKKSKKSE